MSMYTRFLVAAILCWFLPATATHAQTANFTADVVAGCPPLVVNFTNTTGCSSCTYFWDFGNSTTSTLTNPSTTYLTPGTYTVTLTSTGPSGTTTRTMTITVYPLPTVNFTADDTAVCPGTPVTFTSTSTGGVPGPMTYSWGFGDGGFATGSPVTHTFPGPGYYNITLSVTNAQGCTKSLTKTAYVHVYEKPTPNFTVSATSSCTVPATVTFTNLSTGAGPLSYLWSFGDGGTSTSASPSHTYTGTGCYTIKLYVTDANGCMDSLIRPAYVCLTTLVANFTSVTTACVGTPVSFTNTSGPHSSSYWSFGDAGSSGAESPTHTYSAPGTYNVTLTVYSGACSTSVTHTIIITPPPVGSFTITPARPCPPPATIAYAGTAGAGTSISWSFSDGGGGTGPTTTHTYPTTGVFTVTMTMTDANGCVSSISKTDTMYDLHLLVNAGPTAGCAPLPVTFSANAYTTVPGGAMAPYPYGPITYSWDFGDGSGPGSGSSPTHTYTTPGTYTAIVTATTDNGCTVTGSILINVGTPPAVTFTAAPTHVCYGESVTFTPTIVTGPVDAYIWQFGDGGTATTSGGIVYTYTLPGIFTVTLTPYYLGCPGAPFVVTNYITIDSPKAIIADSVACSPRTRVYFRNLSLGDNTHIWLFGDATSSVLDNPVHDYPALGTYTVTLATYNTASGCRDTALAVVTMVDLVPSFVGDDTAICKDETVTFTSTVTGGAASSYTWFVDGVHEHWKVFPTLLDTFNLTGLHSIMLVTEDQNGCKDTARRNNYIITAKPVANFAGAPVSGCAPHPVLFTDGSTDVPGATIIDYAWDFGDATLVSVGVPTVSHTYVSAGVYTVTSIVTDNIGCKDTVVRPAYISVFKPTASFFASNTNPCVNSNVTFTSTSSSGITSYTWYFGDGGTGTGATAVHAYTATGTYTVRLVVVDANGCRDSVTMPAYINANKPDASFNMSDSFSVCPPLMVAFTNTSTGAVSYNWAFGDGNTSVTTSPSNMYTTPGAYTVTLVATNIYGCKDTARRSVSIYGYAGAFSYTPLSGCAPLTVHFTSSVSNVTSIKWDFADGVVSTTPTTITDHVYTSPGAYLPKLILSDNTGCQASSVGLDTIKVDAVFPKWGTLGPVCIGQPVNFADSSTSYWSVVNGWHWTYDGTASTSATPSHTFTATGTYPVTLVATDGWGCTATLTKTVTINPLPTIQASNDTTVCLGDPATLYGYGGVSYTWADGSTLSCTACNPTSANPTAPTTYTVTGTDAGGCQNTDTVRVYHRFKTFAHAWPDTAVCRGTPVPLYDTGGTTYNWTPAFGLDNPSVWNPIATPASTQTYTVIAKLGSCIPDTDYVSLVIYQLPTVDAGPDQRVLAGTSAQLEATGTLINKKWWSPAQDLSCSDCMNAIASMSVTTTYRIDVLSDNGCPASDSVKVVVFCDNSQIFIPNTFTPNGDGQNDIFYPRGKGVKNIHTFRIYNRWGELVYEYDNINANDASVGWDGSYKGNEPRPDVYVYLLEADCSTGEPLKIKGDVTIIR